LVIDTGGRFIFDRMLARRAFIGRGQVVLAADERRDAG
jgi:hypothetical protein